MSTQNLTSSSHAWVPKVRNAYYFIHDWMRCTFRFLLTSVLLLYCVFCLLLLCLRYVVLPNANVYKRTIEHVISHVLQRSVQIGHIHATWQGLKPALVLSNVRLYGVSALPNALPVLSLPHVLGVISWKSIFVGYLRLHHLHIEAPELDITRHADGQVVVAGIPVNGFDTTQESLAHHPSLRWLLSQPVIQIHNARVRWHEAKRNETRLFTHVHLQLYNGWRRHQLRLQAKPSAAIGESLDIRVDIAQPRQTWLNADLSWHQWKGMIYANASGLRMEPWRQDWASWLPLKMNVDTSGMRASVRAWAKIDQGRLHRLIADVQLKDFSVVWPRSTVWPIATISARLVLHQAPLASSPYLLRVEHLTFQTKDGFTLPKTHQAVLTVMLGSVEQAPTELMLYVPRLARSFISQMLSRLTFVEEQHRWLQWIDKTAPQGQWEELTLQLSANQPGIRISGRLCQSGYPQQEVLAFQAVLYHDGIDIQTRVSAVSLVEVGPMFPDSIPGLLPVRSWLTDALQGGWARNMMVHLKGRFAEFPFTKVAPGLGYHFTVTGDIQGAILEYAPRAVKSKKTLQKLPPLWPLLRDIQGYFVFNGVGMQIYATSATSAGVAISNVTAKVADLTAKHPILIIEGHAAGALGAMVYWVNHSPVTTWIYRLTEQTTAKGACTLQLQLRLPLKDRRAIQVEGKLQFLDNDIQFNTFLPVMQRTQGYLHFSHRGFQLEKLKTHLLGGDVNIRGGMRDMLAQEDKTSQPLKKHRTDIQMTGMLKMGEVGTAYSNSLPQHLFPYLSGQIAYQAVLSFTGRQHSLQVMSDLQGLASSLPEPLTKAANEKWPSRFTWRSVATAEEEKASGVKLDAFHVSLGTVLEGRYAHEKMQAIPDWHWLREGVGIDRHAPQPAVGLSVALRADILDGDAWRKILRKGRFDLPAQIWLPDAMTVDVNTFYLMGGKIDKLILAAVRKDSTWVADIDAVQARGKMVWQMPGTPHLGGQMSARLSLLKLPEVAPRRLGEATTVIKNSKDAQTLFDPASLSGIDIEASHFEMAGKAWGSLQMKAENIENKWHVRRLSIINPEARLIGEGSIDPQKETSTLHYTLEVHDAGKLLDRLGLAGVVQGVSGEITGQVSGQLGGYGLFPFNTDTLSGNMTIAMKTGAFLKADPGMAKLLGILNLQALQRRLSLDFRDISSEGFAFDHLAGSAQVERGKIYTDNVNIHGVSATVLIKGFADIVQKTQNLEMTVIPKLNADIASAAAMAIHPMIGVSSFLAQWFLRYPIIQALTQQYQVSGSWHSPIVTKVALPKSSRVVK